jgi:hypothetical protein
VTAPYATCVSWGVLERDGSRFALHCRSGREAIRELRLGAEAAGGVTVLVDGATVPAAAHREGDHHVVTLAEETVLEAGQAIEVRLT